MRKLTPFTPSATALLILIGALIFTWKTDAKSPGKVRLAAPSQAADFVAALISAGPGGQLILGEGIHEIATTVVISAPVTITGEPGAVIVAGTLAAPNLLFVGGPPSPVTPTLHVLGTKDVRVQGLQFRPASGAANCAVLIENSDRVEVLDNEVRGFQSGILVQHGDDVSIRGNTVAIVPLWADPSNPLAQALFFGVTQGINVINGSSAKIVENEVTGASLGIFGNDHGGQILRNSVSGNAIGIVLCNQLPVYLISGRPAGAEQVSSGWHVQNNNAVGNFGVGYMVVDGAHHNVLVNNAGSNNCNPVTGLCRDIELVGRTDYYGIGVVFPPSHDNVVVVGSHQGLIVKDCGDNNTIHGDVILADPTLDPCP